MQDIAGSVTAPGALHHRRQRKRPQLTRRSMCTIMDAWGKQGLPARGAAARWGTRLHGPPRSVLRQWGRSARPRRPTRTCASRRHGLQRCTARYYFTSRIEPRKIHPNVAWLVNIQNQSKAQTCLDIWHQYWRNTAEWLLHQFGACAVPRATAWKTRFTRPQNRQENKMWSRSSVFPPL